MLFLRHWVCDYCVAGATVSVYCKSNDGSLLLLVHIACGAYMFFGSSTISTENKVSPPSRRSYNDSQPARRDLTCPTLSSPNRIVVPYSLNALALVPNTIDCAFFSAVFKVWYSYVSTIIELNVQAITGTPILGMIADIDTDNNNSSSNAAPTSTPRRLEPLPTATAARVSYKDAATRSVAVSHSPTKTAGGAASADGGAVRVSKTSQASSTTSSAAVATPLATVTATAAAASPPAVPSRLQRLEGLREMKITRPMDSVKHLPVFEGLCKGKTSTRPDALPLVDIPTALGQEGTDAVGDEEGANDSKYLYQDSQRSR